MIEIKNLHKSYRKGKDIIPNLNLTFGETGLNIIAGKSGCGKTTLLNIIGSMDMEFDGDIFIDGQSLKKKSYKEIVDYRNFTSAFVFQKNSLFEFLTVEENLRLCMNIQNNEASISDALEKVGLKGFEHKKVKALSGGEKQRVAIARALIKNCKIIFADEPTSALDTKNAHKIFQLFKDISKDKLVVLVTHDIKKATLYADRIVRFVDGVVVEDTVYHETNQEAKILPPRKTKKFALLPIFFNHLKKGLVINLFVILLFMAAIVLTNLAVTGISVKNEYDTFGTDNFEYNVDRMLETTIKNNVHLYEVIKKGEATDPFYTLKTSYKGTTKINDVDQLILEQLLEEYNVYYGTNDSLYNTVLIDGVTHTLTKTKEKNGAKFYWDLLTTSDYKYYLYNEDVEYELSSGRLPNTEDKDEILITDVIAWQYLQNNFAELGFTNKADVRMEDIYNVDFVIYDYYGTYKFLKTEDISNDPNAGAYGEYQIGEPKHYKVVGVIDTKQLLYYEYNTDAFRYDYKPYFKNQDNDRYAIFMNSVKSQPYGYVVLQEPLESSVGHAFYYNTFAPQSLSAIVDNVEFQLSNKNINAFIGEYDYTTNPAEMYDREKRGSSGSFKQYDLAGYEDNLLIDYQNRIIARAMDMGTSSEVKTNLENNEIMISIKMAQQLFPNLSFANDSQRLESFMEISGKEIVLSYNTGEGVRTKTVKIVGLTKNFDSGLFYASNELYQEIYNDLYKQAHTMTIDFKGYSAKEIKSLMELLYDYGYLLSPIDNMPGAYYEFTDGKGETYAEVDGEGLASLYPNYQLKNINGVYYFVNDGLAFGFAEPTFNAYGELRELGTVYMTSSMIRKIVLDESYITKNLGNLSLYYLFSDYYTYENTNSGNYILEIISSMYSFLLVMASIIALGFIYLKENKESGTMTRLSMLGVRPKHIYLIHFVTYFGMAFIICLSSIGLSKLFVDIINSMFTYSFDNGLTIYRYRLLFTNQAIYTSIILSLIMFVVSLMIGVFVTHKSRK